tara:strand:+ start:150 stop:482 length:333 start_codon:yes stop_codon:yes gene_type:complete
MESVKAKELKDDAIINVKVNKTFYMMSKAALLVLFGEVNKEKNNADTFIKNLISKKYEEMSDKERIFYTLTLLIGEIEKQAADTDQLQEKEIDVEKLKSELNKASKSNED